MPKRSARPSARGSPCRSARLGRVRRDLYTLHREWPTTPACVVEIPKGSRNKYEWDHERERLVLDRFLFSSVVYPTDYGFIPETLGQDGDPLDVMICVSEPTFPGCMIDVKPIALFRMEDDKGIDDKVLAVPLSDPGWNTMDTLDDLPDQLRDEIAHFFSIYKDLEQKGVTVDGWYSRDDATKEIDASRKRYAETEHDEPDESEASDEMERRGKEREDENPREPGG
jgi:inorganic pyrophosphatase